MLYNYIYSKLVWRKPIHSSYTYLKRSLSSISNGYKNNCAKMEGLLLKEVVTRIESFAPPSLAQSWDNVGLLVEPSNPMKIDKIILTNDLTEDVMAECVTKGVNMIISYHPPIFKPLKMLTSKAWKERIIISCITNRIALYSPHTSFDTIVGGVNDWLLQPFGTGECKPLEINESGVGPGRVTTLHQPLPLNEVVEKLKSHLHLSHLRLALGMNVDKDKKVIETIAVCAGSGGSLLRNCKADLWITGELSHHEVLDAVHCNTSVILCEHSNTERGFLKDVFRAKLTTLLEHQVAVDVSEKDQDPLCVV